MDVVPAFVGSMAPRGSSKWCQLSSTVCFLASRIQFLFFAHSFSVELGSASYRSVAPATPQTRQPESEAA